jgi:hypothetical protein
MLNLTRYITSDGKYKGFLKSFEQLKDKEQFEKDAKKVIARASEMLSRIGYTKKPVITSGWRPVEHNKAIGGSTNSRHCFCQAIDLWDPDEAIGKGSVLNLEAMTEIGLWMESLVKTHESKDPKGKWVHWQIVPPRSGNRIFLP